MINNNILPTYHKRLQVGYGLDEWPNKLAKRLWVNWPIMPPSSCTCWCFSGVALQEEECPQKMDNLSLMREEVKLDKCTPYAHCNCCAAPKECAKSSVFCSFRAHRLLVSILDVLRDVVEVARRWWALSRSLGLCTTSALGVMHSWGCIIFLARWRIHCWRISNAVKALGQASLRLERETWWTSAPRMGAILLFLYGVHGSV